MRIGQVLQHVEHRDRHDVAPTGQRLHRVGECVQVAEVERVALDAACGVRRQRLGIDVASDVVEAELTQRRCDLRCAAAEIDHEATRCVTVEQRDDVFVAGAGLEVEVVLHAVPAASSCW